MNSGQSKEVAVVHWTIISVLYYVICCKFHTCRRVAHPRLPVLSSTDLLLGGYWAEPS